MAKHYAEQIGCSDAMINLVYHQWMGAFPSNKDYSESLINTSTVIVSMVRADKIITKTREMKHLEFQHENQMQKLKQILSIHIKNVTRYSKYYRWARRRDCNKWSYVNYGSCVQWQSRYFYGEKYLTL